MMEQITLTRSGNSPLCFRGELLATANGQFVGTPPDKQNVDWFELSLYRVAMPVAERPDYIVAVTYRRDFKGAYDEQRLVVATATPAAWFQDFRERQAFLLMVIGFPPGLEDKQRRLEERLSRQFDRLISAVLIEFPNTITAQGAKP